MKIEIELSEETILKIVENVSDLIEKRNLYCKRFSSDTKNKACGLSLDGIHAFIKDLEERQAGKNK